jgi:hypothetical protein
MPTMLILAFGASHQMTRNQTITMCRVLQIHQEFGWQLLNLLSLNGKSI